MGKLTIINMGTGEEFSCESTWDCVVRVTSWEIRKLYEQIEATYRREDVEVNIFDDPDFIDLFDSLDLSEDELNNIREDIYDLYCKLVDNSDDWYQKLANAATEILRPYRERLKGVEE